MCPLYYGCMESVSLSRLSQPAIILMFCIAGSGKTKLVYILLFDVLFFKN